ncbi:hypothetical protein O181_069795, partial [Austropuccinia psidii MF-1]|nr:hypothetical protein [Austropuccinia psidii MF-1]
MVEFNIELTEKFKLNGGNFLDWKIRMKSILQMKRLYSLVLGIEDPVITAELNKLDTEQKVLSFEIICINCDVKIAGPFSAEANDDPALLWTSIDNFYQPKTIQNQTMYLNRIFSAYLPKKILEEASKKLLENTQQLCSLIDDKTTKPSILLDSVVA